MKKYEVSAQHFLGTEEEIGNLPTAPKALDDGTYFVGSDGSTFFAVDTDRLFVFLNGTWYEVGEK